MGRINQRRLEGRCGWQAAPLLRRGKGGAGRAGGVEVVYDGATFKQH